MAFTEEKLPYARQHYFKFFTTGAVSLDEDLTPGYAFEVDYIRVRLSSGHVSVVDFMATLSHHLGSMYDYTFVSQAMSDITNALYQADPPLIFGEGDTIRFSMIMSAANVYGVEVSGWAVTQKPRS